MVNKKFLMMGMILLVGLMFMVNVSAIQYEQIKSFVGDDVIRVFSSVAWEQGEYTNDYVKGGNKMQSYIWYNIYPEKWNRENVNYSVDYCNFSIYFLEHLTDYQRLVYNITYDDENIFNAKYFMELDRGDIYTTKMECKFSEERPDTLQLPADFSIVTPTWECKQCQYYEWLVLQADVEKAKTIGDNTSDIVGYMKLIVLINFEIAVALFWLILLSIGMLASSLIFVGVYWIFLFVRKGVRI